MVVKEVKVYFSLMFLWWKASVIYLLLLFIFYASVPNTIYSNTKSAVEPYALNVLSPFNGISPKFPPPNFIITGAPVLVESYI